MKLGRTICSALVLISIPACSSTPGRTSPATADDSAATTAARPAPEPSAITTTDDACSLAAGGDLTAFDFDGAGTATHDAGMNYGGGALESGGNSETLVLSGEICWWGEEGSTKNGLRVFVSTGLPSTTLETVQKINTQEGSQPVSGVGDFAFQNNFGVTAVRGDTLVLVSTRRGEKSDVLAFTQAVVNAL